MDKLNTILLDSGLHIVEQDTSTIEAFSSLQNYLRVIAPYNTEWIPYAIFYPTNSNNNVGVPAEYLVMSQIDTTTIDGETYYVYETNFPAAVVGSARATQIAVTVAFIAKDENLIGVARYDEDADGYNDTTYIAAQLLIDYPDAVSGNYVRVFNTDTDWSYNGSVWTDTDDITITQLEEHRSDTASYTLRKGTSTSRPTHAPNNTESIIAILNTKISSTEAYDQFYTKTNADLRFVNVTGDIMSGDLDMGGNDLTNVKEINVKEINVKDTVEGEVATIRYLHTNGNNYQVLQIVFPDGRVEEINEVHEYNYRNTETTTLNSGNVLMTDGMTQGNQAVNGILYDESSEYSMNLVGVVTVDGIIQNAKSKATYLGIVTGIDVNTFYSSGTIYEEGQIIYARGGKISNVAPDKPNRITRLGAIINQTGNSYDVVLAPLIFQNFTELNDSIFTHAVDNIPISDGSKLTNLNLPSWYDTRSADLFKNVTFEGSTGILTFTQYDDSTIEVNLPTELIVTSGSYDPVTKDLTLVLASGDEIVIPLDDILEGVATETWVTEQLANYYTKTAADALFDDKLDKDFSGYTIVPVADQDSFPIYDSSGATVGRVTAQALASYVLAESGVFSPNGTYDAQSTGESGLTAELAQQANSQRVFELTKNADGEYYCDTGTNTLLADRVYYFNVPTATEEDDLTISVDGSTGLYKNVTANGENVKTNQANGDIRVKWNGTTFGLVDDDKNIQKSLPYTGVTGTHTLPKNGIATSIARKTLSELDNAYGGDFTQIVSNGNFANGTTDWISTGDGVVSESNGNLLHTAGSSTITPQARQIDKSPLYDKIYFKIKIRVTNTDCDFILIQANGSTSGTNVTVAVQLLPTQNEWYTLSGIFTKTDQLGNLKLNLIHGYADTTTANGKELECEYAIGIPLPDTITTVEGAELYIDTSVYWEGLNWVGKSRTYTPSDYSQSIQDLLTDNGIESGDLIEGHFIETSESNDDNIEVQWIKTPLHEDDTLDTQVKEEVSGVSGTATVNDTLLPLIDTSATFLAEDEVTGEVIEGNYGDTLTFANTAFIVYKLATPISREVEVIGNQIVSPYSTYVQYGSGVVPEFDISSAYSSEGQDDITVDTLIKHDKDIAQIKAEIDYKLAVTEDDLRFPATLIRQGVTTKPDFDTTDMVLLFPINDTTEIAYINAQMPHAWAEGTTIEPHVHYIQEQDQQPVFKIDYRWYNIGDAVPASWTTFTMDTNVIPYVSGDLHQIVQNGGIDGTGFTASSVLQMKLYRDDNVYTGDCKVIEFDIHYKVGRFGKDV